MSLLPVVTSRSSDPLRQHRLLQQVNADQVSLQNLYDQLSTGRRVLSGSDDPAAAARAMGLSASIAHSEQLSKNAQAAAGFLQTADTALGNIDDTITEARGVAVSAVPSTLSSQERETMAQEIDQAIQRIMSLGNDAYQQTAVFGGVLSETAPLTYELEGILYKGNDSLATPKIARNTRVATLATGTEAMGLANPAVKGSPLISALNEDTRLVDMRDGLGITPGIMRLTDGSGWIDLDLRGSVTLGDLKSRFEELDFGGRSLAFDINEDGITLRYADGLNGTLGIDDAPGSATAAQMNIINPLAITAPPLEGGGLGPRTTKLTRLADLNGGTGLDVSPGIRIEYGSQTTDIDLSTAETVDDILTTINRSGAPVRAELDPTTGSIQLRLLLSGVDYSVGELGGQAATNLGIRTVDADTPLSSLLNGRGVQLNPAGQPDLQIQRPDGTILDVDIDGLETIGEVIDAINQHPDNQDVRRITAEMASFGNGIRLWGPVDTEPLTARQLEISNIGNALGLIPTGTDEASSVISGGVSELLGVDPRKVEPGGTLDTLVRLREAVRSGDTYDLERLTSQLDVEFERSSKVRGEIGYRARTVDSMRVEADDQTVVMKARRSEEVDADFTQVISEISTKQSSLEATLQLVGKTAQLTVLNFL